MLRLNHLHPYKVCLEVAGYTYNFQNAMDITFRQLQGVAIKKFIVCRTCKKKLCTDEEYLLVSTTCSHLVITVKRDIKPQGVCVTHLL